MIKIGIGYLGFILLIMFYTAPWEMLAVLGALPLFTSPNGGLHSFFQMNIWAFIIFVLLAARVTVLFAENEPLKVKLIVVIFIAAIVLSTILVIQGSYISV